MGKADAERMLAKAKVYKQYGDAAIMALVLEALPKVGIYLLIWVMSYLYTSGLLAALPA